MRTQGPGTLAAASRPVRLGVNHDIHPEPTSRALTFFRHTPFFGYSGRASSDHPVLPEKQPHQIRNGFTCNPPHKKKLNVRTPLFEYVVYICPTLFECVSCMSTRENSVFTLSTILSALEQAGVYYRKRNTIPDGGAP